MGESETERERKRKRCRGKKKVRKKRWVFNQRLHAFDFPDAIRKIRPQLRGSVLKDVAPGCFLLVFSSKPEMQSLDCEGDRRERAFFGLC